MSSLPTLVKSFSAIFWVKGHHFFLSDFNKRITVFRLFTDLMAFIFEGCPCKPCTVSFQCVAMLFYEHIIENSVTVFFMAWLQWQQREPGPVKTQRAQSQRDCRRTGCESAVSDSRPHPSDSTHDPQQLSSEQAPSDVLYCSGCSWIFSISNSDGNNRPLLGHPSVHLLFSSSFPLSNGGGIHPKHIHPSTRPDSASDKTNCHQTKGEISYYAHGTPYLTAVDSETVTWSISRGVIMRSQAGSGVRICEQPLCLQAGRLFPALNKMHGHPHINNDTQATSVYMR